MARWPEQLERIERWASRLDCLMNGESVFDRQAACYADDFHAFFVECHHMKDWLIKDSEIGDFDKSPREIEALIDDTPCLSFCADLCNMKKHLVLEMKRKGKREPTNRYKEVNAEGKEVKVEGLRFAFVVGGVNDESFGDGGNDHDPYVEAGENSVGAVQADKVRETWQTCEMGDEKITIQVFCDPIAGGSWTGTGFDGAVDLANQAVKTWRKFVGSP